MTKTEVATKPILNSLQRTALRNIEKMIEEEMGNLERCFQAGQDSLEKIDSGFNQIRDEELFVEYGTYNKYCQSRWKFTPRANYNLIEKAGGWKKLAAPEKPKPENPPSALGSTRNGDTEEGGDESSEVEEDEGVLADNGEQEEPEENLSAAILQAINTEKIKPTANQRKALAELPEDVQDAIAESVIAGRESLGTAISNGCAADPTVEERLAAQSKQIESTCRKITDFAKEQIDALTDPWLDDSGRRNLALDEIKKACNTLRSAKASGKCPKCDGEGCRTCHTTGYVNRYTLQQVA